MIFKVSVACPECSMDTSQTIIQLRERTGDVVEVDLDMLAMDGFVCEHCGTEFGVELDKCAY